MDSAIPSSPLYLYEFEESTTSQYGEDGVLTKIFEELNVDRGYFVEFGAWDGKHLSNTYPLYENGWSGLYIEGDEARFVDLCANITSSRVATLNRFVTVDGENCLDRLLASVDAPKDFDLLSVDIDSDDLAVWRSLRNHSPKVVVIEYNPTIPLDVVFENPASRNWGNSALAIRIFADEAGYGLVYGSLVNLVFLREDCLTASRIAETSLDAISRRAKPMRCFWGYDGTLLTRPAWKTGMPSGETGLVPVPWSGAALPQPLPKFLRRYPRSSLSEKTLRWLSLFKRIFRLEGWR